MSGAATTAVLAAPTDRRARLLDAARELFEQGGPEALTIRALGSAVGIKGPSVYKHFPDKTAVEDALTVAVLHERAAALAAVEPTFAVLADAYRTWAVDHPHLHRLIHGRPLNRELTEGVEFLAAAPLKSALDGDMDLARAAWATIAGLVDLELADRFPPGTDVTRVYAAAARAYEGARPRPAKRTSTSGGRRRTGQARDGSG